MINLTRRRFIAGLAAAPLAVKALFQPSVAAMPDLRALSELQGTTTLRWWYYEDPHALDALVELIEAQGASLYEDAEGNLVFETESTNA